jgi:hypothetical protein
MVDKLVVHGKEGKDRKRACKFDKEEWISL